MNRLPEIIVSTYDLDRLVQLLSNLPDRGRKVVSGLQTELDRATVMEPASIPSTVVTMNSVVRFRVSGSIETRTARLCFPKDADGSMDRLSVLTPVGTALLGLSEGKDIAWSGPDGHPIVVSVEQVVFQPERSVTCIA